MFKKSNWFERHPKTTFFFVYLFLLLCTEGVLQATKVFLDKGLSRIEPIPYTYSRETFYDYLPNIRFIRYLAKQDHHSPVTNVVNSLAFRGPEVKEKREYRVINLGDSFVEAEEIPFEKTFGELLNYYFAGRMEFISKGMSGWAPTTEFSWLYHTGVSLNPDEVNLFLCVNDFHRKEANSKTDQKYRQRAVYRGAIPIAYNLEGLSIKTHDVDLALKSWIINHVETVNLIYRQLYAPLKEKWKREIRKDVIVDHASEIILLDKDVSQWPPELKKNVDETIQVVKNIELFLKGREIKLNLWVVPLGFAWSNESLLGKKGYHWDKEFTVAQEGIEQYLKIVFTKMGIPYLDLRSEFESAKKSDPERELFLPADAHWNENGHHAVFEALRKHYEKQRYILSTKSSHNLTAQ